MKVHWRYDGAGTMRLLEAVVEFAVEPLVGVGSCICRRIDEISIGGGGDTMYLGSYLGTQLLKYIGVEPVNWAGLGF